MSTPSCLLLFFVIRYYYFQNESIIPIGHYSFQIESRYDAAIQERIDKMKKNLGVKNLMFPMPVLMIASYNEDGTPNVMNAAWGGITLEDEITICIDTAHKTWTNIAAKKAFTVAFGTAPTVKSCDYLGIVSGNKTPDKVAKSGFTTVKSEFVDAPVINELPLVLECKLVSMTEANCNVVGKIVNCAVEESAMTDGKPDADKMKPICFDTCAHVYRLMGEVVAKAFSCGAELK